MSASGYVRPRPRAHKLGDMASAAGCVAQLDKNAIVEAEQVDDLLREAIVQGDDKSFEALAATGSVAVERFRLWMAGETSITFPRGRDREFIDTTSGLAARLGMRFPDAFLAAFNDGRWISNSFVLTGLGYTGRTEATPLLVAALGSNAPGVTRLSAAISLGMLPGPDAVEALMRALDDDEYLVQYHSINSLGQVGDRSSLDRLIEIAANPPSRGIAIVAPRAAANLASRLGVTVSIPQPDMSRWPPLRFRIADEES